MSSASIGAGGDDMLRAARLLADRLPDPLHPLAAVACGEMQRKPVAVLSAGTSGGQHATPRRLLARTNSFGPSESWVSAPAFEGGSAAMRAATLAVEPEKPAEARWLLVT